MRILVACEFSGRVRDAFVRRGHEAMSCDLLPTEAPGPHYQGDVRDVLGDGWDLMVAHPPCTYLAASGLHWNRRRPDRAKLTDDALAFVRLLLDAPIPRIALENPVGAISSAIRPPDQTIHPSWFGHQESKATCLWLKNLPRLLPTQQAMPEAYGCACGHRFPLSLGKYGCPNCAGDHGAAKLVFQNQTASGQNRMPPSPDRWKDRSRTYAGVAEAMAEQWGRVLESGDFVRNAEQLSLYQDAAACVASRNPGVSATKTE